MYHPLCHKIILFQKIILWIGVAKVLLSIKKGTSNSHCMLRQCDRTFFTICSTFMFRKLSCIEVWIKPKKVLLSYSQKFLKFTEKTCETKYFLRTKKVIFLFEEHQFWWNKLIKLKLFNCVQIWVALSTFIKVESLKNCQQNLF